MPLAKRSSAPADASAAFFAGSAPLTMKLAPGSAWNTGVSVGSLTQSCAQATRPRSASTRVGIDRQHPVEARAQLAPGIGRVAAIEGERKAVGDDAGLAIARRVEALRLDRGVGRDANIGRLEAVAAFEPPAVALRVEVSGQVIAGKGEAVG